MRFLAFVLLFFFGPAFCYEDIKKIREDILKDYDRDVLPLKKTEVKMGFEILHVDMNERTHAVELQLWIKMYWTDPRLTWDKTKHPKPLMFSPSEVWVPDITLFNNVDAGNFKHLVDSPVVVINETVIWVPPTNVAARCTMDTTYWPHDVHNCTAKFGSWVYDAEVVDLQKSEKIFGFPDSYDKEKKTFSYSEWKLNDIIAVRTVKTYECCSEPYVSMSIEAILERNSPAFQWLVQIPAVGLALLTVTVFMFPPTSGEKIYLGAIGLMGNLMFLCSASYQIGHAPTHVPLIIKLIVNQFILTLTSLIICAHVIRISKDPHSSGLPRMIRATVFSFSGLLCLDNYKQAVSHSNAAKRDDTALAEAESGRGPPESGDGGRKEWILLGAFIDRIFLIIYCAIFLINMIYFSGVL